VFPENSVFTIQGRDTVDFQFQNAPYKILTYVDSVGCLSCKLHLPIWSRYIHWLDSITEGKVPVVFYMQAKDVEELTFITQRDRFHYPICLDVMGELNRLNNMPTYMMYQTFLLDRENRVLAIGNPILDMELRDRYYEILENGKTINKQPQTRISIDSVDINLGQLRQGDKIRHEFILTNTGDNDLIIREVIPSCDCLEVSYDNNPISQEESTVIQVMLNAEVKGDYINIIFVYANTEDSPLELCLSGFIE